jgi:hypothetical protein
MSGAAWENMFRLQDQAGRLSPLLRLKLIASLKKYCPKCGRLGKKESRGYGVTSFSCDGKSERHERVEWDAEEI